MNPFISNDPHLNRARAMILVQEAWRQEKTHLKHQLVYLSHVIEEKRTDLPIPCACCTLPANRSLDVQGRVENILLQFYAKEEAASTTRQLLKEYHDRELDLMDDLVSQLGEEPECASPEQRLASVRRKLQCVDARWTCIAKDVKKAVANEDYNNVIRHLSVMRIFLEGSQAARYCCDVKERARRDALHLANLQKLGISPKV